MLCIEMEYADGGNLGQYLVKRLDERDILVFFHQIAAAIRYMHEHHVLHRYKFNRTIIFHKYIFLFFTDLE